MRQTKQKANPLSLQVKDMDSAKLQVTIYVSAFGNKDSDGDIIEKGAFSKTIKERGPLGSKRIKHLKQHSVWDVVGAPLEMAENNTGLLVVSQLSKSTDGRDTYADYEANLYEHSVGFEIIKESQKSDANYIHEIKLWEYSSVTWGANELTPLVAMKGIDLGMFVEKLNKRTDRLSQALKNGTHTEEKLNEFAYELDLIKSYYNDLIKEPDHTTTFDEIIGAFKNELTILKKP